MTKRCRVCCKGYLEPPLKGGHFYRCDNCGEELFVDDYTDKQQSAALERLYLAAQSIINEISDPKLKSELEGRTLDYKASVIRGAAFPGREREQWSATQVTDWLRQQAAYYDQSARYVDDINHAIAAIYRELASQFPSALRKMWSSLEVHEWLDNVADNTQVNFDKPGQ